MLFHLDSHPAFTHGNVVGLVEFQPRQDVCVCVYMFVGEGGALKHFVSIMMSLTAAIMYYISSMITE